MTAINNVFGNAFQYDSLLDKDVYGNVREWDAVEITNNPASGWIARTQERVWRPNTGLVIFNVQRKTS